VTYFFSTSGGHTENVENVFLGSSPKGYLRGVDDPYDDNSPYHRWQVRVSNKSLDRQLGGYCVGSFKKIKVLERGSSPRIVRARVYCSKGSRLINGPTLRSHLGLRDSWALFTKVSSSQARSSRSIGGPWARATRLTPLTLTGTFSPAPRGRALVVERRNGKRWKAVRKVRTTRAGRYEAKVPRSGVYRVRSGGVAGPASRIRV